MAIKKLKKNQEKQRYRKNSNDNLSSTLSQVEVNSTQMYTGYYSQGFNNLARNFLSTVSQDRRFYAVAVESVKAQIRMEIKRQIISEEDGRLIIEAMNKIKKKIYDGSLLIDDSFKNIYDALEKFLEFEIGATAYKLNIARSRNEQVVGDTKLWIRDAYDAIDTALQNAQEALIDKSEENVKTVIPSFIGMQIASPVSLGHHLMAFVDMLGRDRQRIREARGRVNTSPFGSGELGGTSFNINREMVARILGFDKPNTNSIDSITDQDYIIEFMSVCSICSNHLAKLAEDLIQWQSSISGCISFSENFVTKHILFPNMSEPEILELVRASTGKVYGALMNTLTVLKGLATNVCYDLRTTQEPLFNTYDTLLSCTNVIAALIADFKVNHKRFKELAQRDYSVALDLTDWLVENTSLEYVEAVHKAQSIIQHGIEQGKKLSLLSLEELQEIVPEANKDIYSVLIPSRTIISRRSKGGSNPVQVRKAIRAARREYL